MDGNVCPLDKIYELANKYDAMVMVDESHSAGVVGKTGRGVTELHNLRGKIEILTGTLGKAFGGAVGGFTTGKNKNYMPLFAAWWNNKIVTGSSESGNIYELDEHYYSVECGAG